MASKERLDIIFSEYIRRRDADENGYIRCISCGKVVHWKQSDCGHYINRKHNSTRYDEHNCNAQCRTCNRFDEGNIQGYRRGLIKKIGLKATDMLEVKKHNICKMGAFEMEALTKVYKAKLKAIRTEKKI